MKRKRTFFLLCCVGAMILILFDSGNALQGAKDGIELCLYTILPTLFPYCVISILFRSLISESNPKWIRPFEHICALPQGTGVIFLLGLLGGYPIGAMCVEKAIAERKISVNDAKYLRPVCNNAGPSFIIGVIGFILQQKQLAFIIIVIQAFSALFTYLLLSKEIKTNITTSHNTPISISNAISQAYPCMIYVCSIIILFRVFLSIIQCHLQTIVPTEIWTIIVGIIELTNGILLLPTLGNNSAIFIAAAAMTSLGGLCVIAQSLAISAKGSGKSYISAKTIQAAISFILAHIYTQIQQVYCFIVFMIVIFWVARIIKIRITNFCNIAKNSRNSQENTV